jgi:putative ATPase
MKDIRQGRILPVPVHLRDGHYAGAEKLGHSEGYQYSHNCEDGVAAQDYLGVDVEYYQPVNRGHEKEIAERLIKIREKIRTAKAVEQV